MTTQQIDLKPRIVAILRELSDTGTKSAEAMWVLGSIASAIMTDAKADSWSALRRSISDPDRIFLLKAFANRGKEFADTQNLYGAYAVQALEITLYASKNPDPQVEEGAALIDEVIDRAATFFRNNPPKKPN